jgi:hypothetical protein
VPCAALLLIAGAALADWLQPDPTLRDAQRDLRDAVRDTTGFGGDPARLDSLGWALLRLNRQDEARLILHRVYDVSPLDEGARAGLGKIALFEDSTARAETLLTGVSDDNVPAMIDRFAAQVRGGAWTAAAALAESVGQGGRADLLREMAENGAYVMSPPAGVARAPWSRAWPVPLVHVKLNGQSVVMAVDTGTGDVLIDDSAARRDGVRSAGGPTPAFWCGTRVTVRPAMVQRLEIGGVRIERVPAGVLSLHKYSLQVNPQAEGIAGVIGLNLLRRFTPTFDFRAQRLELRPADTAYVAGSDAQRLHFQNWGEGELTVIGTVNTAPRRMAMVVATGVPDCGIGAPQEVFEEVGIKPGMVDRIVRGAGSWLNGKAWTAVVVPTATLGTGTRGVGMITREKLPGWLGGLDPFEMWVHGVRRDALVGCEMLRTKRVTIDWRMRQLVVE